MLTLAPISCPWRMPPSCRCAFDSTGQQGNMSRPQSARPANRLAEDKGTEPCNELPSSLRHRYSCTSLDVKVAWLF